MAYVIPKTDWTATDVVQSSDMKRIEGNTADNRTQITTEASTRASADTTLQANINAEASTRASADTTLQANIDAEASTRSIQDGILDVNKLNVNTYRIRSYLSFSLSSSVYTFNAGTQFVYIYPTSASTVVRLQVRDSGGTWQNMGLISSGASGNAEDILYQSLIISDGSNIRLLWVSGSVDGFITLIG